MGTFHEAFIGCETETDPQTLHGVAQMTGVRVLGATGDGDA